MKHVTVCEGRCDLCEVEGCFDRINPPHWPMETTVIVEEDGLVGERVKPNIKDGKFLVDQVYGIRVNTGEDESVTVHRCMIVKGTQVEKGYEAVREFIKFLLDEDTDPIPVIRAMGFYEVIGEVAPEKV